jgi:hypothetical protein
MLFFSPFSRLNDRIMLHNIFFFAHIIKKMCSFAEKQDSTGQCKNRIVLYGIRLGSK